MGIKENRRMDLSKVLTTATLAKAVQIGVRSGLKRGKRFVKQTFAQKHLWWIFPLLIWSVGVFVIYQMWKWFIESTFGKVARSWWQLWGIIPIVGYPAWYTMIFDPEEWMRRIGELIGTFQPTDEQKAQIQSFASDMKIALVIWTVICLILTMWLYSQKQQRKWGRPIFIGET